MIEADVAASQGAARWSVAECGWKKLLPDLPDDVIALLADPVVVSAQALAGPPTQIVDAKPTGYGDRVPTFLAPAAPRARRARHRI
jgi:hypothetical protein